MLTGPPCAGQRCNRPLNSRISLISVKLRESFTPRWSLQRVRCGTKCGPSEIHTSWYCCDVSNTYVLDCFSNDLRLYYFVYFARRTVRVKPNTGCSHIVCAKAVSRSYCIEIVLYTILAQTPGGSMDSK